MTPNILEWIKDSIEKWGVPTDKNTIEFGSKIENPDIDPVRSLFKGPYLGIDMRPGFGVDQVIKVDSLDYTFGGKYDVCICTEMLEHDLTFWQTLQQAMWVLKDDGLFILSTCGYGFPVHNYPSDYYRFTRGAIFDLLRYVTFEPLEVKEINGPSIVALARK